MKDFPTRNHVLIALVIGIIVIISFMYWGYWQYNLATETNSNSAIIASNDSSEYPIINGQKYYSITETTSLYTSQKQIDMFDWIDPVTNERNQVTQDQFVALRSGELGQPMQPYFDISLVKNDVMQKILDEYQNPKITSMGYEIGESILQTGLRIKIAKLLTNKESENSEILTQDYITPIGKNEYLILFSNTEFLQSTEHQKLSTH